MAVEKSATDAYLVFSMAVIMIMSLFVWLPYDDHDI